jgi:hypothetical protein
MAMNGIDWHRLLATYLIGGGVKGRKQGEITYRFKRYTYVDEIDKELNAMHRAGKAQKFLLPARSGKGSKSLVWRATTKLREGWP